MGNWRVAPELNKAAEKFSKHDVPRTTYHKQFTFSTVDINDKGLTWFKKWGYHTTTREISVIVQDTLSRPRFTIKRWAVTVPIPFQLRTFTVQMSKTNRYKELF